MPYNKEQIAGALRANRARKHITLEQLSAETGIPAATIKTYESARSVMSLENAVILADYYDKDLDELIERKRTA